jgi:sortase family protein
VTVPVRWWLRPLVAALAVVFAVGGTTLLAMGLVAQPEMPPPPALIAAPATTPPATTPSATAPPTKAAGRVPARRPVAATGSVLRRSVPVRLEVPAVEVRTAVVPIGLRKDGSLAVPALSGDAPAGWYDGSPTPGETGSSVIVGHVDSARDGPAVFYPLRLVRTGDRIVVTRADGSTATFAVTRVALYPKDAFPSREVYGPTDRPTLTLITCGGVFDRTHGTYRSNLIVFTRAV